MPDNGLRESVSVDESDFVDVTFESSFGLKRFTANSADVLSF